MINQIIYTIYQKITDSVLAMIVNSNSMIKTGKHITERLMMDKLFECATTYKQLLSTQYNMIAGRKRKTINISIKFNDTPARTS